MYRVNFGGVKRPASGYNRTFNDTLLPSPNVGRLAVAGGEVNRSVCKMRFA